MTSSLSMTFFQSLSEFESSGLSTLQYDHQNCCHPFSDMNIWFAYSIIFYCLISQNLYFRFLSKFFLDFLTLSFCCQKSYHIKLPSVGPKILDIQLFQVSLEIVLGFPHLQCDHLLNPTCRAPPPLDWTRGDLLFSHSSHISYISQTSYISQISHISHLSYISQISQITQITQIYHISHISHISHVSHISHISHISQSSHIYQHHKCNNHPAHAQCNQKQR